MAFPLTRQKRTDAAVQLAENNKTTHCHSRKTVMRKEVEKIWCVPNLNSSSGSVSVALSVTKSEIDVPK